MRGNMGRLGDFFFSQCVCVGMLNRNLANQIVINLVPTPCIPSMEV